MDSWQNSRITWDSVLWSLKSSYRQESLHKRAKTFCDLRSFSPELRETPILHIRQESQVVREMSPSPKLQETVYRNVRSLVTWDWTQGRVSQVHPISQEFFSHNLRLMAKFSHNLRLDVGSDGCPAARVFQVVSNTQVTFGRRATDLKLFGNFASWHNQLVQCNCPA